MTFAHGQRVITSDTAQPRAGARGTIQSTFEGQGGTWGVCHDDGVVERYPTSDLSPAPGIRRYNLAAPRAQQVAERLAKERSGEVWNWEVLEALAETLKVEPDAVEVEFIRREPSGRVVCYSLREMQIAIHQKIECRPPEAPKRVGCEGTGCEHWDAARVACTIEGEPCPRPQPDWQKIMAAVSASLRDLGSRAGRISAVSQARADALSQAASMIDAAIESLEGPP